MFFSLFCFACFNCLCELFLYYFSLVFVVYEITAVHMIFFCCPFSVVSLVRFRLFLIVNVYSACG